MKLLLLLLEAGWEVCWEACRDKDKGGGGGGDGEAVAVTATVGLVGVTGGETLLLLVGGRLFVG